MAVQYLQILLLLASLAGFSISFYIRHKKSRRLPLVCPVGASCEEVIWSQYSKFFGIPLELIGFAYYGLIFLSYGLFWARPDFASPTIVFATLVLSTTAFLFSVYLTFIQAFNLKQWCSWCLMSAGLSTIILVSALFISQFGFLDLLARHHNLIVVVHILGMALGLGGATITDVFFFRFLKDFKISSEETGTMHILSQFIWFALAIIVLSGLGLYLPEAGALNHSPWFLAKMVAVAAIIINGAFLNLLIAPRLVDISFPRINETSSPEKVVRLRKVAFALGAISLISWYSAFILGILGQVPFSLLTLLGIYVGALLVGIIGSQIFERSLSKQAKSSY